MPIIYKKSLLFFFGIIFTFIQINITEATDQKKYQMPQIQPPAEFDQLKQLEGIWEGTQETPDGKKQMIVEYQVTSGGTAVMEKMFPGTKEEMLSIYHGQKNHLMMTHYCAFGNQPRMKTESSGDKGSLKFVFLDGTNSRSMDEPHMHQLTLSLVNKEQLIHEWVFFDKGKSSQVVKFEFHRKK
jgi:hypothetical protein